MIEIKNSLYNSKERKNQNKFNRYIQLKGKIRLKLKKFFPLSENEKIIYEHKYYEKEISKPLDGRYLEYNKRIHLLSVIPKSELNNFYLNYMNLVKKNPSKNSFSRRIVDDRVKNAILSFKNSYGGWTVLNEITPQSTDLSNIVDYITMYMFNLSDDYVGISFIITLNSNFNIELNKAIIGNVQNEINYIKMYVGNKKRISYSQQSKEIIRKNKIETILLEVKMRVYEFLRQYINLPILNGYAPICLEEYITNYKKGDNDYFLRSYDFYSFSFDREYKEIPIIINTKEEQLFKNIDMYFECGYEKKINRSARILIEYNNEEKDNFFEYPDFIPIYMNIIYFYFNIEYNEILAKKRDILNLILKNKNEDIYSKYIEINKEISYYEGILSSISIKYYNDLYVNKDIKSTFNYQKSRYKYLYNKNKKIDQEFNNYIATKSSKDSLHLSKVSIWIAIISLIVTMLFSILSYVDSKKEENIPIVIFSAKKLDKTC